MSLIHEALQKAAREKQRNAGHLPPPAAVPPPAAKPDRFPVGAILSAVVAAALLVGVFIVSRPAAPQKSVPPPRPVAPPAPPAAVEFQLTGIMQDVDGKYLAVLNGRPVAEGQYVGGATVKRVERDRVILERDGHETTVPYNR